MYECALRSKRAKSLDVADIVERQPDFSRPHPRVALVVDKYVVAISVGSKFMDLLNVVHLCLDAVHGGTAPSTDALPLGSG